MAAKVNFWTVVLSFPEVENTSLFNIDDGTSAHDLDYLDERRVTTVNHGDRQCDVHVQVADGFLFAILIAREASESSQHRPDDYVFVIENGATPKVTPGHVCIDLETNCGVFGYVRGGPGPHELKLALETIAAEHGHGYRRAPCIEYAMDGRVFKEVIKSIREAVGLKFRFSLEAEGVSSGPMDALRKIIAPRIVSESKVLELSLVPEEKFTVDDETKKEVLNLRKNGVVISMKQAVDLSSHTWDTLSSNSVNRKFSVESLELYREWLADSSTGRGKIDLKVDRFAVSGDGYQIKAFAKKAQQFQSMFRSS